jgi:hypothetical protein
MGRGRRSEIWIFSSILYTRFVFLTYLLFKYIYFTSIILYPDRGTGTIELGSRST